MAQSTDDLVHQAADAVRPIFQQTVQELGLGTEQARRLMLRIVEAYIKGRGDGADIFALQLNHALAADGVAAAVRPRHTALRRHESGEEHGEAAAFG
jgi:hypothetical protein